MDLPTPGSPPTRSAEPGTSPPPATRSNSAHAGGAARGFFALGFQSFQREWPALCRAARAYACRRRGSFFSQRIPRAACLAAPRPFRIGGAAGLADKSNVRARLHSIFHLPLCGEVDPPKQVRRRIGWGAMAKPYPTLAATRPSLPIKGEGKYCVQLPPHFHLDRAFGAAVDELVDVGIAAVVDVAWSGRAR